jgi:hypothetical protein
LEPKDGGIIKEKDITPFMMEYFDTPELKNNLEHFYNTEAIKFLEQLCEKKFFIQYAENALEKVATWANPKGDDQYHYWFNTVEPKVKVQITDIGLEHLQTYRINEILRLTNQSTIDTNEALQRNLKYQIIMGIITTIAIALTAIYAVTAYYKDDSENLIAIRKSMQRQEQQSDSILQLQKERNTYLKIMAKKTLPKKK